MFFDTDCAAVVHNIAYLRIIEVARTLLAEQLGMGLVAMAQSQLYPVVVRTEIDYRRPARLGDQLRTHGRLRFRRTLPLLVPLRGPPPRRWHPSRHRTPNARPRANALRTPGPPASRLARALRPPLPGIKLPAPCVLSRFQP